MQILELVPLAPKTTMHIGGQARYFAECVTKADIEEAVKFATGKNLPLVVLGGGSNTIFADGTIQALVVRITAQTLEIKGNSVHAEAGLPLATLIAKLTEANLDLSALTGIPGTLGGAIFGNAGQGPKGIWLDRFVESVTIFADAKWQLLPKAECGFSYRQSIFKHWPTHNSPIIGEATLTIPARPKSEIQTEIDRLMKKRLESQLFAKTAGSCFKALPDGTPAWKAIEAAGLKGKTVGGVAVSEKHANFLINEAGGTFADAKQLIAEIRNRTKTPLELEIRCITEDGSILS